MMYSTRNAITSIAIILMLSSIAYSNTVIRITNGEWEPYLSEYSYQYGLASHIVTEAFRLEEITVEWGFFPWKRSYFLAKHGEWDATAVWWDSEDGRSNFLLSTPVVSTSFVFFHLKSRTIQWNTMDDLKRYRMGGTGGYEYGLDLMTAIKNKEIPIEFVPTDEQNLKKLLLDRLDIFPNDPIVGYAQIRNTFSPDIAQKFTHHPKVFNPNTLHLFISNKSKNKKFFLEKFNSGLNKLKESGRFDQMFKDMESGRYDKQKDIWVKH
ncbi:MAG: transporter substrate-binding domain-containing protein [Fibrobacterales bacterium]